MSVELLNNVSYQLLRTNPKLSTNVKIVVNSQGNLFLESFDASPELADSRYKSFSVKEKSSLAADLYSFYNNGRFPRDLAYRVFEESSIFSPLEKYGSQYETLYNAGTQALPSTAYSEDMSIFAPLWMGDTLPSYFVIFRIEGPLSINEVNSATENAGYKDLLDGSKFSEYVLNKSTAVKTFDLRENTSIGKYVRNLQDDPDFTSGIQFHTTESVPTRWNGIAYREGGFKSSPEYDYEKLIVEDSSIIETEFFLTTGFERNGIVHPKLLNLQFLFSDENAEDYEIHRYFGMYVNEVEEGSFSIDSSETFYGTADDIKQQPIPPSVTYVSQDLETEFETTNPEGVKLFVNGSSISTQTELPTPTSTAAVDSIFYVKDKDGEFHQLKRGSQWNTNELRLADKKVDLSKFTGFTATSFQAKAQVEEFAGRASAMLEVTGTLPDGFTITFRDGLSAIGTLSAEDSLDPTKANGLFFSTQGSFAEVAEAIEGSLNNIPEDQRFFSVYREGAKLYFYSRYSGNRFDNLNILYFNFGSSLDFIESYPEVNSSFITNFIGGNDTKNSRLRIKQEDKVNFAVGNYLKTDTGYAEITEISLYVDDPVLDDNNKIVSFNGLETYYAVVTDGKNLKLNSFNEAIVYEPFKPTFGRFSFFPVKDLDFDFFSEEYSQLGELETEKEFYTDESNPLAFHPDVEAFYEEGGFANIQGVIEDVQVNSVQPDQILSEYDRLNENYVKELAVNSRVVPYINKWGFSEDGKDVRNHPYRLDNSRAFGSFNFGPTNQVFNRDTSAFTHEWYYLSKAPSYFEEADIKESWSYFSEKLLEVDLKNTAEDKFKEYFIVDVVNDYAGNPILIDKQFRYSEIDGGNEDRFAQSFLRGVKIVPKEKANYGEALAFNAKSLPTVKNERFNGYRFSSVLIPNDDDEPNFKIKFIENKKWKTLTMLIYLRIDISCFDEGEAIVDRTMLYALRSKIEAATGCDFLEPTGGYLYEDIRISGGIDASYPTGSLTNRLRGLQNTVDGSFPNFLEEIRVRSGGGGDGTFPDIVFEVNTGTVTQQGFYKVQGITRILSSNELEFTQILKWDGSAYTIPVTWPRTFGFDDFKSVIMYTVDSGFEGLSPRINQASFASILENVNEGDPNIEYVSVDSSGNETSGEYLVELITPNGFIKPVYIHSIPDPDKPVQFNLVDTVGYRLSLMNKTRLVPFFRHEGTYEPLFNDVLKYVDPYVGPNNPTGSTGQDDINRNIRDLCRHKNTQFNVSDSTFGLIKNLFYHKVNPVDPGSVTQLSAESAYQSVYPLIAEVAIDKKDFYIFASNWDPAYFTQNLSGNDIILRNGTRSQREKKSFFASKVMKTPQEIVIQTFSPVPFDKKALIDPTRVEGNLMYQDTATEVNLLSLTTKRATEYFFDFVKTEFQKYINPRYSFGSEETIDDDVNQYILQNILTIYKIKSISLFVRRVNGDGVISYSFMGDDNNDKIQNGLSLTDNFSITYPTDRRLDFSLIYNLDKGYNYDFGLSVTLEKK